MKSPKDRYENDPVYHKLVDTIHAMLRDAYLTPSEVRECAVLACIHYEMSNVFKCYTVPSGVNRALETLAEWRKENHEQTR